MNTEYKIGALQELAHAISNRVYAPGQHYARMKEANGNREPIYVRIQNAVFILDRADYIPQGSIGLSKKQREFLRLSPSLDSVSLALFTLPNAEYSLSLMKVEVAPVKPDDREVTDEALEKLFKQLYISAFFSKDQEVYFEYEGVGYFGRISQIMLNDSAIKRIDLPFGMLKTDTDLEFSAKPGSKLKVRSSSNKLKAIFRPDFRFEDMGVGGLDREIGDIFRRAFSSRRVPSQVLAQYGIKHVKGLLLYGPPGTGKTLIARQLAKVLHSKEPKIVNGPELFNKYVGETESNVRKLFDDAKRDQVTLGEESPLHVVIFDEFDAIAKHRGMDSSGTGVGDNVVNQLLAMIDGVEALDNILVIGMTNRLDLIDKAVLRPGRFEVHIEVGLPDEAGRVQIINIHTKTMKNSGLLGQDVDLKQLAERMKNYTGAEIEAVVKSASSFALNRHHQLLKFDQKVVISAPGKVEMRDFEAALDEVRPEYGVDDSRLEVFARDSFFQYGSRLSILMSDALRIMQEVGSEGLPLASLLLYGGPGSGKTTLAVKVALQAGFPFVKFIGAEDLIGKSESYKTNYLIRQFDDAYKSKKSLIILDDLERLVEYVEVGNRINNNLLQAVLVLTRRRPPKIGHALGIVATSSNHEFLKNFAILNEFNIKMEVPDVCFNFKGENEIANIIKDRFGVKINNTLGQKPNFKIPIKRLVFILNIIDKNKGKAPIEQLFSDALRIVGSENAADEKTDFTF